MFRVLRVKKYFSFLFIVLFIAIGTAIKAYVFEMFEAPGRSMEDAIFPNDIVLVNKISRHFSAFKSADILVFKLAEGGYITKRCIGVPGAQIEAINGIIYSDGKAVQEALTVKNNYNISVKFKRGFHAFADSVSVKNKIYLDSGNFYHGTLSMKEIQLIGKYPAIGRLILRDTSKYPFVLENHLEGVNPLRWGPVKVPRKGDVITLNPSTYRFYKNWLSAYENVEIKAIGHNYFVGKAKIDSYSIKYNYYFVMGDNRPSSIDSRYFGFVCEKSILGKVQMVLFSRGRDE